MVVEMVVELDPVSDHAIGMLECFEAVAMHTSLLERASHALDHPILLRTDSAA